MNEQEFDALIAKIEASIGGTIDSKLRAEFKKLDPMVLKAIDTDSTVLNQKVTGLESANKKLLDAQKKLHFTRMLYQRQEMARERQERQLKEKNSLTEYGDGDANRVSQRLDSSHAGSSISTTAGELNRYNLVSQRKR